MLTLPAKAALPTLQMRIEEDTAQLKEIYKDFGLSKCNFVRVLQGSLCHYFSYSFFSQHKVMPPVTEEILKKLKPEIADSLRKLISIVQKSGQAIFTHQKNISSTEFIIITPELHVLCLAESVGKGAYKVAYKVKNFFNEKQQFIALSTTRIIDPEQTMADSLYEANREELNIRRFQGIPGIATHFFSCRWISQMNASLRVTHLFITTLGNLDSLQDYLTLERPTQEKLFIAGELLNTFTHLHPTYIHADLKPSNIVLQGEKDDKEFHVKSVMVIDFGNTYTEKEMKVLSGKYSKLELTSPSYTSTESAQSLLSTQIDTYNRQLTAPHDLFSLGLIFYELFFGAGEHFNLLKPKEPYQRDEWLLAISEFQGLDYSEITNPFKHLLLSSTLQPDPRNRLSAKELHGKFKALCTPTPISALLPSPALTFPAASKKRKPEEMEPASAGAEPVKSKPKVSRELDELQAPRDQQI